ncbi:MAG: hypothetical protein KDM91_14785, partial [Verrucomicrobiae bacterium]|nr:hypothetical protein [Verrucomicrobiae bacterium]
MPIDKAAAAIIAPRKTVPKRRRKDSERKTAAEMEGKRRKTSYNDEFVMNFTVFLIIFDTISKRARDSRFGSIQEKIPAPQPACFSIDRAFHSMRLAKAEKGSRRTSAMMPTHPRKKNRLPVFSFPAFMFSIENESQ